MNNHGAGSGGKFRRVCVYIVGTELMERMAYYSLANNLVLFFTRSLGFPTDTADSVVALFSSLGMVCSLLGGYISDVWLGRYRTIVCFCTLYIVAITGCAAAAAPTVLSAPLFLISLFLVAVAAGGIKPNVSTLGADQFDLRIPAEALEKQSFFNWFYFAINCGATFAVAFAYVSQNGAGSAIPRDWGFCVSWALPAAGFAIATALFCWRSNRYVMFPPTGSEVAEIVDVVRRFAFKPPPGAIATQALLASEGSASSTAAAAAAAHVTTTPVPVRQAQRLIYALLGTGPGVLLLMVSVATRGKIRTLCSVVGTAVILAALLSMVVLAKPTAEALLQWHGSSSTVPAGGKRNLLAHRQRRRKLSTRPRGARGGDAKLKASLLADDEQVHADEIHTSLDSDDCGSQTVASGTQSANVGEDRVVNAVAVLRLMPFLGLVSFYWTLYSAMATTFVNQGCQMDLRLGSFELPVVALGLVNTVGILVLIPTFDRLVFPAIARWRGAPPSMLTKMGTGFVLICVAMLCAAAVEHARIAAFERGELVGPSPCYSAVEGGGQQMVQLSVFWQVPQYFFVGASEVFTSVTSLDFFFSESPAAVKSVVQACNLCCIGLGGFLGAGIMVLVNVNLDDPWIADDANHGHLQRYFLLLALLVLIPCAEFARRARRYVYRTPAPGVESSSAVLAGGRTVAGAAVTPGWNVPGSSGGAAQVCPGGIELTDMYNDL